MRALLDRLVARFTDLEDRLNTLDAAVGDGDHGTTMLTGLRAAAAAEDAPPVAFRNAAGGVAGSLFGSILQALAAATAGEPLAGALSRSAARIERLGNAKPGDKTLLDALHPAIEAAEAAEETGAENRASIAGIAAKAASVGAAATCNMAARRGRARYVEGAGLGHVDPGATSVAEILAVYAAYREEQQ